MPEELQAGPPPPVDTGYLASDVERFLAAAADRAAQLQAEIEALTTEGESLDAERQAAEDRRRRIAEAWLESHREAAERRARADVEAEAIVAGARRIADARARLQRRATEQVGNP